MFGQFADKFEDKQIDGRTRIVSLHLQLGGTA